jgi:hypothetical protein
MTNTSMRNMLMRHLDTALAWRSDLPIAMMDTARIVRDQLGNRGIHSKGLPQLIGRLQKGLVPAAAPAGLQLWIAINRL